MKRLKVNQLITNTKRLLLLLAAVLLIAGPAAAQNQGQTAVTATAAADFSSGGISLVEAGGDYTVTEAVVSSETSDIVVDAYGEHFYLLQRFGFDSITRFHVDAPATPVWNYSVSEGGVSANPYDMVFVSDSKAYVIRYGEETIWVVDPSATTSARFKTGEIDLSSYTDSDGIPEIAAGALADGKLFVIIQRLDENTTYWDPANTAYVAVIDTTTDTEIDTGMDNEGGRMGIPLSVRNPTSVQYLEDTGLVYVGAVGGYPSSLAVTGYEWTGGIVSIDPDAYDVAMILDDGDADSHPYGAIAQVSLVDAQKGYFVGYHDWGVNSLYSFNPATGEAADAVPDELRNIDIVGRGGNQSRALVAGVENISIAGNSGGVNVDDDDNVWICDRTNSRLIVVDSADDSIVKRVDLEQAPSNVVFVDNSGGGSSSGGSSSGGSSSGGGGCFINRITLR